MSILSSAADADSQRQQQQPMLDIDWLMGAGEGGWDSASSTQNALCTTAHGLRACVCLGVTGIQVQDIKIAKIILRLNSLVFLSEYPERTRIP